MHRHRIALFVFLLAATLALPLIAQRPTPEQQEATRKDHQQMLDQLKITSLRPGANPNNPQAPRRHLPMLSIAMAFC
jgi:hypothetical protein